MAGRFEVKFSQEVVDFLDQLEEKVRDKVLFNVDKAKVENDPKLFKKLNKDIWEFRTRYANKQYRLFAFWDKTDNKVTIVVATHGMVKKTQRIPSKEIDRAVQMMKEYFNSKK